MVHSKTYQRTAANANSISSLWPDFEAGISYESGHKLLLLRHVVLCLLELYQSGVWSP